MNKFSQRSLKQQFLMIAIGLVSIFLFIAILSYFVIENLIIQNVNNHVENTVNQFYSEIEYNIRKVDALLVQTACDESIQNLMLTPYSENTPLYIRDIMVQFSSYSNMNEEISDLALYSKDMSWSNLYNASTLRNFSCEMKKSYGIYSFGLCNASFGSLSNRTKQQLVFGYNLYGNQHDNSYGEYLGAIILSLDLNKSSAYISTNDDNTYFNILIDLDGDYFSFNSPPEKVEAFWEQRQNYYPLPQRQSDIFETSEYLVHSHFIENADVFLLTAFDKNVLNKKIWSTTIQILLVIAFAFLMVLFLLYMILQNMVSPIQQLSNYICNIKNQVPNAPSSPLLLLGCKEIVTLNQSFHELLAEQEALTKSLHEATIKLYETKLGKKQAELDFLRSQINPHFLYNTLECIKYIAIESDVYEISNIASSMATLFRYNVKGSAMVTLKEEIAVTRAYLEIQQSRFPKKLEVIYSIAEDTLDIPVMKLILQPLIENAVFHGIEPKSDPCTLFIGTQFAENFLVIRIYDDGVGMSAQQLFRIRKALERISLSSDPHKKHIGIINVQHRLYLRYGSNYQFLLDSEPNHGTQIVLRIPAGKEGGKS